MRCAKWVVGALAVALCLSSYSLSEEAHHHSEADKAQKQAKTRKARLIAPYNKLESLTDEQRDKLQEIHAVYLEKIKALQEEERQQMLAVLTDEQRAELDQIEKEAEAARKAKEAERREQQKQAAREAQKEKKDKSSESAD